MFKIGQKVICINDISHIIYNIKELIKNNEYIICDIDFATGDIKVDLKSDLYWCSSRFKLLSPKSAIKELVKSFVEVKETSDIPIKELV